MKPIFVVILCLFIISVHSSENKTTKVASITEEDIKEFREKHHVEPINDLHDLDANSDDVKDVYEKIDELEKRGLELRNRVADNGATCSIQVRYYIKEIIVRAKEHCDYCVLKNLNKGDESTLNDLNIIQKNCTLDILRSARQELEEMSPAVEACRSKL